MGTRHLILVYYKGEYQIAQYGQWDGYPDGQGVEVLGFIRDPANITKLQAALDKGMIYNPTHAQLEEINQKIMMAENERQQRLVSGETSIVGDGDISALSVAYPTLSRDTGAKILQFVADAIEPVPIQLEVEFISDTLFCEWAYVVDLDTRELEVYSGEQPGEPGGRFQHLYGPGVVAKFGFDHLPEDADFLELLEQCGQD